MVAFFQKPALVGFDSGSGKLVGAVLPLTYPGSKPTKRRKYKYNSHYYSSKHRIFDRSAPAIEETWWRRTDQLQPRSVLPHWCLPLWISVSIWTASPSPLMNHLSVKISSPQRNKLIVKLDISWILQIPENIITAILSLRDKLIIGSNADFNRVSFKNSLQIFKFFCQVFDIFS